MAWRGFRRLAGQLRQKVSPNRALAAVLSKVTKEEEESLRLIANELRDIPIMLRHVQRIYKKLSIFLNNLEALSRFEQKKLQRSILIQKACMKMGSAFQGIKDAGFQPAVEPQLPKTMMMIRAQAQKSAGEAMLALGKHQQLITLSQEISKSMRLLSTKIGVIVSVETKLAQLSQSEAEDEKNADRLAASPPEIRPPN
jgi:hypothetical protein